MIGLNPNPQTGGYAYMPLQSVTSRFPVDNDVSGAVQALSQAGFSDDQINVFSGDFGADQLDTKGQSHGVFVRFVRAVEDIFTDESQVFERADETMRAGGSVVTVFTTGEEAERQQASVILKSFGGIDTIYWGRLVTEYM